MLNVENMGEEGQCWNTPFILAPISKDFYVGLTHQMKLQRENQCVIKDLVPKSLKRNQKTIRENKTLMKRKDTSLIQTT